jgi:hypothetical protein
MGVEYGLNIIPECPIVNFLAGLNSWFVGGHKGLNYFRFVGRMRVRPVRQVVPELWLTG